MHTLHNLVLLYNHAVRLFSPKKMSQYINCLVTAISCRQFQDYATNCLSCLFCKFRAFYA